MDRDLLVGILAWRRGWVAHDALLSAIEEAGSRRGGSVAAVLVERRALTAEQREELARLAADEPTRIQEQIDRQAKTDIAWAALKQSITSLAGPRAEETLALFDDGPVLADLDDSPVSIKPGVIVDGTARFEVVRMHARGGLGEVHLARELGVPREVALKEIQPQYARDSECRRRFVCEAEVTGSLEHPGIVPVYSLGKHADGRPFYVMRFIAGQTLGDAINDYHHPASDDPAAADPAARELAFRKLLDRYLDICQTIAYAHSRGVLHRDLKPDNVMLGAYGETLVVDWGLAKRVEVPESPKKPQGPPRPGSDAATVLEPGATPRTDAAPPATPNAGPPPGPSDKTVAPDATRLGTIIGTPAYMSPEQALGWHDRLGPPADVFSLGAILYVILTGRPAAAGTSVQDVLQKAQTCQFARPSSLAPQTPAALEAICLKAMSKAATDRHPTAAELAADVEAYLADQPVSAWQEPWHVTAGRWIRRHRTWAIGIGAGGGVLLACMLVGLVLLSSFNDQLRTERDRATTNFGLARKAVDRYLMRVSNDPRLRAVGLESLRRDLLRDAGEFHREFIEREGKQAHLQLDLARAYFGLGSITAEIDSTAEGVKLMEEALQVQQELAAREPGNVEVAEFGANLRNDLANLLVQMGRRERAVELYQASCETFASLPPSSDEVRNRARALMIGSGQHNLGLAYHYLDRHADARAAYERAAKQFAGLVDPAAASKEESFSDPRFAVAVALAARNSRELGILDHDEGKLDDAAREYESARQAFAALVKAVPGESEYQTDLIGMYINLASLAHDQRQIEAGLKHCDVGLALVVPLRVRHPQIDEYHALEGKLLGTRATLLWKSGQTDEALAASGQAIGIRRGLVQRRPEQYEYRMQLAGSLSNDAVIRLNVRRLDGVPELFAEAIKLHTALAAGDRQPSEHRFQLAKDHDNLGGYYALIGELERALAEFQPARGEAERLVREYPNLPHYREFLLANSTNYSNVANRLRRFDESGAALTEAKSHAAELVQRFPQNLSSWRAQTQVEFALGQLAGERKQPAEAIEHLQAAVGQRQALVEKNAGIVELKKDLATARFELARTYTQAMKPDEAEREFTATVELYRTLTSEPAAALEAELRLAQTLHNRGAARWVAGKDDLAAADLEEAIRLGGKILAARGTSTDLAVEVAASQGLLSRFKLADKRPLEALPHLTAAIDLLWPERDKLAAFPLGRVTLDHALAARAAVQSAAGEHAAAAEDWGRAAEIAAGQTKVERQINRLVSLNAAGDHEGTIAGTVAMVREHDADHDLRWLLALGSGMAAAAAEKNDRLSEEDRRKWSERYAATSNLLLDQLAAADQLTDARRTMLATDPRWEWMRQQGKLKKYESP